MSSTTIGHLRNHSRGERPRSAVVNSGEARLPLFAPGSRGKTDVMRSDKSDATAENWATGSTQKFSNEHSRQHPRVPFHREFPTVEYRDPRAASHVSRRRMISAQHSRKLLMFRVKICSTFA